MMQDKNIYLMKNLLIIAVQCKVLKLFHIVETILKNFVAGIITMQHLQALLANP